MSARPTDTGTLSIITPLIAHLVGVCGSGMRAVAELLVDRGWSVTGSDEQVASRNAAALRSLGVRVAAGHAAERVVGAQRVIYSPAIDEGNVERRRAAELNIPQQSLPEFLGGLTALHPAICVAGTHGKSTTAALAGWTLQQAGFSPQVLCGAELVDRGRHGWSGAGQWLVTESCEFRRNFLRQSPRIAIVTGIEWDHVDCFGSVEETIEAFAAFLARVPKDGAIVWNADCRAAAEAARRVCENRTGEQPRLISFGSGGHADWTIETSSVAAGHVVTLTGPEGEVRALRLLIAGRHNAFNAAAAALAVREAGLPWNRISSSLASFRGVRRRLELIGHWRGMTLFDDYAHHPTAIRCGLATLRQRFPDAPIRIVFEPHQIRRTKQFQSEFADALSPADEAWVLPAYGARESTGPAGLEASRQLVDAAVRKGASCRLLESLDHVRPTLETGARPGDVVVLMGAGPIERIADELSRTVCRHHAG